MTKVRITLGFDNKGNVRFGSKDGFGSLDPDTLYTIIDVRSILFYFCYFDLFKFILFKVAKSASKYLHECYLKQIK